MATATNEYNETVLTPQFITGMICANGDQSWAFRSVLLLVRYMEHDLAGYRKSVGKVENRNSPRYWLDWMSRSLINRTMRVSDSLRGVPQVASDPKWFLDHGRGLSGSHAQAMVAFFNEPAVAQTVYDLATGKITLPPLPSN